MSIHKKNEELNDLAEIVKEVELSSSSNNDKVGSGEKSEAVDFSKLQEDYKEAIKEAEHLKDQLLRNLAETENLRKRTAKQIDDSNKFAVTNFAKDLIDVLENLYLATSNISAKDLERDSMFSSLYKGIEMTQNTLINTFEKYGIKRIYPAIGDLFDHNFHEAVSQVEKPDSAPNTVISVMRAGYTIHDRLLKPAMVVVVKTMAE